MGRSGSTLWSVIEGAANGDRKERDAFARRYLPIVRAYLGARWQGLSLLQALDDAVQEVFVDCFREGGALVKADRARGPFLPFFYGVVRNVALRIERDWARRRERPAGDDSRLERIRGREESLSRLFDRAWALSLLEQAVSLHRRAAREGDPDRRRRTELLRLRFEQGLPIREIARLWEEDAARLHKEFAKARREFRNVLVDVVAYHHPGTPGEVRRECATLLRHFQ